MAILRLWPSTNGPATTVADSDNYTMGTEFYVTAAATATAVLVWRPATSPAATVSVGIYQITATNGTAGTLVASETGVSIPANYNGWYRVPLTTPPTLTASAAETLPAYKTVVSFTTDNFYPATAAYFSTGGGGSGLANGILHAPNNGGGIGSRPQGVFAASSSLTFPADGFNASNYWVDVEVDDGVSTGPGQGSGAGAVAWVGAAVGSTARSGSGSGSVAWSGAASGTAPTIGAASGSGSGTTAWTGSAAGARASAGSGSGATAWTGHAIGENGDTLTVAQENALTSGVQGRAWWYDYATDDIPAFPRSTYYLPGDTVEFSADFNSAFTATVWRLGWYGGDDNARQVDTITGTPTAQPAAVTIPNSNGAKSCAAWSVNLTWDVPADATPGWYWILMRNTAETQWGGVLFCVSDANAKRPIVVVSSDATWHAAYNGYGGNNVYGASNGIGTITQRALCSTYDKPVISRDNVPQTHFFNGEMAQLRFLERCGFNVGYTTCEQIDADPTILDGRELVIFSGHNEYISQRIRDKTEAILAAGTNVANFSANDFFWRTCYGDTAGFTHGTHGGRVMWCKKDTMSGPSTHVAGTPFTTQADWMGTWQDTRWTSRDPSRNLLGDDFIANGIRADQIKVPFAMKALPIWRNCPGVQALTAGQTLSFVAGSAGMEWDYPDPSGTLPSVPLSSSTVTLTGAASDANGENYNGNATVAHAMQMVRNGSAHVFNANTTQWGWALSDFHLRGTAAASADAQQATLNVLVDLGATPDAASVSTASLTLPTPVSDIDTAYGLPADTPGEGIGGGTTAWTGTATGSTPHSGSGSGVIAWSGSGAGASVRQGSGAGVTTWAGSATGAADRAGSGSGSTAWSGSASGFAPIVDGNSGAGVGTVEWVGTATGVRDPLGSAVGTTAWNGTATGARISLGSGAGLTTWTGEATTAERGTPVDSPTLTLTTPASILELAAPPSTLALTETP